MIRISKLYGQDTLYIFSERVTNKGYHASYETIHDIENSFNKNRGGKIKTFLLFFIKLIYVKNVWEFLVYLFSHSIFQKLKIFLLLQCLLAV